MAAPKSTKKDPSVLVARAKKTFALPPAVLGFSALVNPTSYEEGPLTYSGNFHFNGLSLQALTDLIEEKALGDMLKELEKEAATAEVSLAGVAPTSAKSWLEGKLKEPKPGSKQTDPFLKITTKAEGKTKTGEVYTKKIPAFDAKNQPLDLTKLRLGADSVVQPIVYINLSYRRIDIPGQKSIKIIAPSLQLAGIRILKLVQWGGSGANAAPEMDEAELARILGDDFDLDEDLSAYAKGSDDAAASEKPLDDDVAF